MRTAILGLALALLLTPAFAGDYQPVDVSKLPEVKQSKLGLYLSAPEAYNMKSEGGAKVLFIDIRTKGEFQFVGTPTVTDQNIPYMEIDDPTTWDKKNNRYSIAFAFRPGASVVRYSYELPYEGNAASVKLPTIHAGALLVVAPPTVQVNGDGLAPGGQEQGMNLYGRQDVPVGTLVAVNLSGSAPPPNANARGEQGQQGRDAQQGGSEGGANIQAVPGRLDDVKWPLIGLFLVAFAAGGYLLSRKAVVVAAGSEQVEAGASAPKKAKKTAPQQAAPVHAVSPAPEAPAPARDAVAIAPTNGAATLKEVDAAIGTSLDALKESLFRLELRRQAGTISEEEYARERARAEKVLRDLVRG